MSNGTTSRRQIRTRADLVSTARRLTADRGLGGFTIPEVCDEVGISRRTFFNYFPSKESAVLGLENGLDEDLFADFLDARAVPPAERRDLIDDMFDLVVAHFDAMNPQASDVDLLVAVLQREPKLIGTAIKASHAEQERLVARLLGADSTQDPQQVEVAIATFNALVNVSVEACLREGNLLSFGVILRSRIHAARILFSPAAPSAASASAASAPTRNLVTTT